MESLKPLRSLRDLMEMIRRDPSLGSLFALDDQEILRSLRETLEFRPLYQAIQDHIQKYGDRTLHELKLETKSMRDDPTLLIRVIRSALSCEEVRLPKGREEDRAGESRIEATLRKNLSARLSFRFLLKGVREGITHRENMRFARTRAYGLVKEIFRAIGDTFYRQGMLDQPDDIFFLTMDEIFSIITGSAIDLDPKSTVQRRRERYLNHQQSPTPPSRILTRGIAANSPRYPYEGLEAASPCKDSAFKGIGCSPGQVSGRARIVRNPDPSQKADGNILVAEMTDPGWVFLMMGARGLVVERGSILSHTAIIGRELGIPTIVSAKDATKIIPEGAMIWMDGGTGEVRWQ